jgi:glycosyltransferase involved in cell wall biosynthesis
MISILMIAPSLAKAGMEVQLVTLLRHLDPQKFRVELAVFRDIPSSLKDQVPSNVRIIDLKKRGRVDVAFLRRLYCLIRDTRCDLIHGKISGVNELLMFFCGWLRRDRVLFDIRSTKTLAPYYFAMRWGFRLFRGRRWMVLSNNNRAIGELRRYLPSSVPIRFVGNGLDAASFPFHGEGRGGELFRIGFVGRVIPLKNLETLLRAAALAVRSGIPLQVAIVGRQEDRAYARRLNRLIRRYKLTQHVVFDEWEADVRTAYLRFDAFVLPSMFEGTPNVLLEAMASGCPCLVSHGANTDRFVTGRYEFATKNAKDLAAKLSALVRLSPEERSAIGETNRKFVAERYSIEMMVNRYQAAWEAIADESFQPVDASAPAPEAAWKVNRRSPDRPPRVSVIIPSYNRKELLAKAIESVQRQTYKDFEIIVADDGSTDGTPAFLAERYGDAVRVLALPHTGLPASGRNAGTLAARGEFLAFLDSDDLWLPHKLEQQVHAAERYPDAALFYSLAQKIGSPAVKGVTMSFHYRPSGRVFYFLVFYNFIPTLTTMVRRSVLEDVGLFDTDPELRAAEDYDLWLRIARRHEVRYVRGILAQYRLHSENISSNIFSGFDRWEMILKRIFHEYGTPEFIRRKAFSHIEMGRFQFGLLLRDRVADVRPALHRAIRIDPYCVSAYCGLALLKYLGFDRMKRMVTFFRAQLVQWARP